MIFKFVQFMTFWCRIWQQWWVQFYLEKNYFFSKTHQLFYIELLIYKHLNIQCIIDSKLLECGSLTILGLHKGFKVWCRYICRSNRLRSIQIQTGLNALHKNISSKKKKLYTIYFSTYTLLFNMLFNIDINFVVKESMM